MKGVLGSVSKDAGCCIKVLQYLCQHGLLFPLVVGIALFDTDPVCMKFSVFWNWSKYHPSHDFIKSSLLVWMETNNVLPSMSMEIHWDVLRHCCFCPTRPLHPISMLANKSKAWTAIADDLWWSNSLTYDDLVSLISCCGDNEVLKGLIICLKVVKQAPQLTSAACFKRTFLVVICRQEQWLENSVRLLFFGPNVCRTRWKNTFVCGVHCTEMSPWIVTSHGLEHHSILLTVKQRLKNPQVSRIWIWNVKHSLLTFLYLDWQSMWSCSRSLALIWEAHLLTSLALTAPTPTFLRVWPQEWPFRCYASQVSASHSVHYTKYDRNRKEPVPVRQ